MHKTWFFFSDYTKPYIGKKYEKEKRNEKTVRFYDEKEWRFVKKPKPFVTKNLTHSRLEPISKDITHLKFNTDDIKFIIVKKEKEIPVLTKFINKVFVNQINDENKMMVFASKIISLEQIQENV